MNPLNRLRERYAKKNAGSNASTPKPASQRVRGKDPKSHMGEFLRTRLIEVTTSKSARVAKENAAAFSVMEEELDSALQHISQGKQWDGISALSTTLAALMPVVRESLGGKGVGRPLKQEQLALKLCAAHLRAAIPNLPQATLLGLDQHLGTMGARSGLVGHVIGLIKVSVKAELLHRATHEQPQPALQAKPENGAAPRPQLGPLELKGLKATPRQWDRLSEAELDKIQALSSELMALAKALGTPQVNGLFSGTPFTQSDVTDIASRALAAKLVLAKALIEKTTPAKIAVMSPTELAQSDKAIQLLEARRTTASNLGVVKPLVELRIVFQASLQAAMAETDPNKKLGQLLVCAEQAALAQHQFPQMPLNHGVLNRGIDSFCKGELVNAKLATLVDAEGTLALLALSYPSDPNVLQLTISVKAELVVRSIRTMSNKQLKLEHLTEGNVLDLKKSTLSQLHKRAKQLLDALKADPRARAMLALTVFTLDELDFVRQHAANAIKLHDKARRDAAEEPADLDEVADLRKRLGSFRGIQSEAEAAPDHIGMQVAQDEKSFIDIEKSALEAQAFFAKLKPIRIAEAGVDLVRELLVEMELALTVAATPEALGVLVKSSESLRTVLVEHEAAGLSTLAVAQENVAGLRETVAAGERVVADRKAVADDAGLVVAKDALALAEEDLAEAEEDLTEIQQAMAQAEAVFKRVSDAQLLASTSARNARDAGKRPGSETTETPGPKPF
ncbi:hypothetical protein [Hydrogenophaga sp. BPS33]|uniref:hypothetical protein n=1 Tax=Hydrogenophaga sp. BPS33 TaxID=2651974 RepID=UPI00131FB212|nr:hypothetical protein [Hydrogenophaga sp. BPS33]QHE85181.1 hypothetical protein F9K07_09920 [Hydrogenophaga sp. BPS33]